MKGSLITRAAAAVGMAFAIAEVMSGGANASDSLARADAGASRMLMADSPDEGGGSAPEAAAGSTRGTATAVPVEGSCSAAFAEAGAGLTLAGAPAAGHAGPAAAVAQAPAQASARTLAAPDTGDVEPEPAVQTAAPKKWLATAPRRIKPKPLLPVPDEAKKVWWPAKSEGKLNLRFAGQTSFSGAISLLFDGEFKTGDSANQNIQVKDSKGNAVQGRWVVASNSRILLFRAAPGLYSVDVGAGLVDQGGRGISASSSGLVFVQ